MLEHAAYGVEYKQLSETLDLVAEERAIAAAESARAAAALASARHDDPDAVSVREMLLSSSEQTQRNLALSSKSPYFTRVDFRNQGEARTTVCYIGKTGVINTRTLEAAVVDWRAPIANLYYSGQLGSVSYEAPSGRIEGELLLKRQLTVRDGALESIFDTDLVSRDQFLQSVLGQVSGDRLKEIVTTIQAEQNYVIRYPLTTSLIVQGVAGSGKTTIALHRIAYLLYAFQNQIRPEQMLILAPNPLFLTFIAGVLPDLGVERVRQTTFPRLMRDWLGSKLPKVRPHADEASQSAQDAIRFKGSLAMRDLINDWLDGYERSFARPVWMGRVALYEGWEMERFLLVDEKPFPMERRLMEFKKPLTARVKAAVARMEARLIADYDDRLRKLLAGREGGRTLNAERIQLVAERDEKIAKARAFVKTFVQSVFSQMPSIKPLECYRAFLESLLTSQDPDARQAAQFTLDALGQGRAICPEDVPALAIIALRLNTTQRPAFRHIVVDEAQDFSPMQFFALNAYAPLAATTAVGDLMQGIRAYRGLLDWSDLKDILGPDTAVHHLVTSYRNTVEIMETAIRVARKHPVPDQREARPVLRHGAPVGLYPLASPEARARWVRERVDACLAEGYTSIAVIARDQRKLDALSPSLPDASFLDLEGEEYKTGVLLCQADAVKGFEFDAVILCDAGEADFPDDAKSARVLYVALTRALHRMDVGYTGALSPLMR